MPTTETPPEEQALMKICANCGTENVEEATYCTNCGEALDVIDVTDAAAGAEETYEEQAPAVEEETYEEPAPAPMVAERRGGNTFAVLLSFASVVALVVAAVVTYTRGASNTSLVDTKIIDFSQPFRLYSWRLLQFWGPALVVLVATFWLALGRRHRVGPSAALIGAGAVLLMQYGAAFGQIAANDLPVTGIKIGWGVALDLGGAAAALIAGLIGAIAAKRA